MWHQQASFIPHPKWLKSLVKQNCRDQFYQNWSEAISTSSKCRIYRVFKQELSIENYLLTTSAKVRKQLVRFRTRNHRLPVETGSWVGLELQQRKCPFCPSYVGDEYHYIFECMKFGACRKKFLPEKIRRHPNTFKLDLIMNTENKFLLHSLYILIKTIMEEFNK